MRTTERRRLALVVLSGVTLRLAAAAYFGNGVGEHQPGVADQLSYHTLATRVLDGYGFSFATGWWPATPAGEPTAHWSYLYTWFLAIVYGAFGPHPLGARVLQAVVTGVLHPWLTWRIARRLFGPGTAHASAWLAAIYPYFVYYAGALMTESFYIVSVLWLIDLALSIGDRETGRAGWGRWVCFGVATAAAILLRQAVLLCVPLVAAWIAWRCVSARLRSGATVVAALRPVAAGAALAALVTAMCVAPATFRNYRVFGQFVAINTNAGFAFFWGNHPIHGNTFFPLLPGNGSEYGALVPDELRHLDEAALDRALFARGVRFVADDPARYLRLTAGRLREYFKFWPTAESGVASNVLRVASFGLLLPLLVLGVPLAWNGGLAEAAAGKADRGAALLLLGVAAGYTALHVLVWALVRYRLPVDALLTPFAGMSLVWLRDKVRSAGWRPFFHSMPSATR